MNAVDQYHGHGQEFEDEIARQNGLVLVEHASIEIIQGLLAELLNLPADDRERDGRMAGDVFRVTVTDLHVVRFEQLVNDVQKFDEEMTNFPVTTAEEKSAM